MRNLNLFKPKHKTIPKIVGYINTRLGKFNNILCDCCNGRLKKGFNFCPTCGKYIEWDKIKDVSSDFYKTITF